MNEIQGIATVISVPVVEESRDRSLERMRRRMIQETDAVAAVTIGGRTEEGGTHKPGVRDEVRMARASEIPVFPLGATGGTSARIAAETGQEEPPLGELNDAPNIDNHWLAVTDDYSGAAAMIWAATVG